MTEYIGPQQSGTCTAYRIEVEDKNGFWEPMQIFEVQCGLGVPPSLFNKGIFEEAGLYGYEAAMALAWQYKAAVPFASVRIIPLKMTHSIATESAGEPIKLARGEG